MGPRRFRLLTFAACSVFVASCDSNAVREKIEATFHIDKALPAIESKGYGQFSPAPGVVADRVSYATAYHMRVPAIVYHSQHPTVKRGPALIIVNGHGGDKSSWYAYWAGILYARVGAVVLTYDPIGEFERNHLRESNTGQHDELLLPEDMGRRMGGLMVDDIRQAVSYLRQRKDVDRGRVAILGYSMGSFVSSLACAVETRAHACVLVAGGDLDGPGGYWDSSGKKMCQAIPYQSLSFLGNRGAVIFALSPPTLVWNGSADTVVDIPHHGPAFFAALKEQSKDAFEYGFTPDGGHRPYFITKPVALWLAKKLRFPDLTETSIESMPETHIAEWATEHHLSGANFQNEKNEGGTFALGNNIPAVSRDLLHALPEAVWEEDERRYVYETWVERASASVRNAVP